MKNWVVVLLLIVFFPVGLYLMWAKTNWKKNTKIIVTVVVAFLAIIGLISNASGSNSSNNTNNVIGSTISTTAEETTTEEITTVEITTVAPTTEEPTTEKVVTEPPTEKVTESSAISENSNNNFQIYDNEEQQNTTEYVLNTNTKKVHKSYCSAVKKISPENYATISSLEDAFAQGYEPCGICNP